MYTVLPFRPSASVSAQSRVDAWRRMETSVRSNMMDSVLSERAQQLFLLTDLERKGFIVKRDMQRMRTEIPLAPEQLEAVFDSLDVKGNGYLTIEQFLEGFGKFLKSHTSSNGTRLRNAPAEDIYSADEDSVVSLHTPDEDEDEDHFSFLLQQLHSTNILHNVDILRGLCQRVQREASPQMQVNLEKFLQQLVSDLKRRQNEQWTLEETLRARDENHNKQVQKLFEEMEAQLTEDKENLLRQEEQRLRLSQKTLEEELLQKDEFLKDVLVRQKEMSEQLQTFRLRETNVRQENIKLIRRKEELELKLDGQCEEIYNLQKNLDEIQMNDTIERRKNLAAGFRMAQRIMLEQQGLLQQLQLVRNMATTIKESHTETLDKNFENKKWPSAPDKSR